MVYNALQASGCGPVGRALDLGAGAPNRRQNYLSPKPVAALALFFLTSPLLWSKIAFDHMFDHFGRIPSTSYPGVAQLVGRLIWVCRGGIRDRVRRNAAKPCNTCACRISPDSRKQHKSGFDHINDHRQKKLYFYPSPWYHGRKVNIRV